jgi:hypothetical protein
MKQKHNMLLAGVAALALLAGGGIAAAQQTPQGQNNAGAGMSPPGTAQKPPGKPSGAASGVEQHAQTKSPSEAATSPLAKTSQPSMAKQGTDNAKSLNKSAQTGMEKGGQDAKQSAQSSRERVGENAKSLNDKSSSEAKQRVGENAEQNAKKTAKTDSTSATRERIGAREKSRHEHMGANIRSEHEHSRISKRSDRGHTRMSERGERKSELKGLQGNTSLPMQGSHVNLTSEQRTTIRDSVIDARGAPRVGHVNFDVTVGTLVPRDRVHVVRVPETLVRIDPQWHGYLYFVVENEVVIVNPRDMRIVAVLDV